MIKMRLEREKDRLFCYKKRPEKDTLLVLIMLRGKDFTDLWQILGRAELVQ